jgi:hypothetical protein
LTKKKERIADPSSLARNHTVRAIQTIAGIMDNGQSEDLKMRASDLLLQRGWGRPPDKTHVKGSLEVIIRKMTNGE